MRTRERGGFVSPIAVSVYGYKNAASQNLTTTATNASGTYEIMHDVTTPGFTPGKTVVNNHMSHITTQKTCSPSVGGQYAANPSPQNGALISWTGSAYFGLYESEFDKDVRNSPLFDYHHINSLACTSALAGVRKPEVAGLVAIKEMGSTVRTLLNPIKGMTDYLRKQVPVRRKADWRTRNIAKAVADQHLSIIFGVMPFVEDINGTLKALREAEFMSERWTSRGSASEVANTNRVLTQDWSDATTTCIDTIRFTHTRTVNTRAYVLYEAVASLQQALGLSLHDLPSAIWQTMPYSFLVDWAFNVNSFIRAVTPKTGLNMLAQGFTPTIVDIHSASFQRQLNAKTNNGWNGSWSGGVQTRSRVTKLRVPGSISGMVGLHHKENMNQNVFDLYRITAAMSLLTQQLTRFK